MPQGALNLTREAKRRSEEAALQVQGIEAAGGMLALSETRRKQTTKTIDSSKDQFDETQADNQQKLDEVLAQIDNLEGKIPDLNKKVSVSFPQPVCKYLFLPPTPSFPRFATGPRAWQSPATSFVVAPDATSAEASPA